MPVEEGTEIDEYHIEAVIPQQTASIKDSQQLEWRGSLAVKMYIYGTRQEEILTELNVAPINPDVFEKLPGFVIYYVKPGDSLWQIGKKYYVSVQQIKSLNNLTGDDIKPGDKLLIVK
jgi:LysM repeat protein